MSIKIKAITTILAFILVSVVCLVCAFALPNADANLNGNLNYENTASITVSENISSYGTATGSGVYRIGETVTLNAQTNTGNEFLVWATSTDPETMEILSADPNYSFTFKLDSPREYYAIFNQTTTENLFFNNSYYTLYNEAKLAEFSLYYSPSSHVDSIEKIIVDSSSIKYKVYSISSTAFSGDAIQSVVIPENIFIIKDGAFSSAVNIVSVRIDSPNIAILDVSNSGLLSYSQTVYVKKGLNVGNYINENFNKMESSSMSEYYEYRRNYNSSLVFQPINTINPLIANDSYNTVEGAEDHVAYMIGNGSTTEANGYTGVGETIQIPNTYRGKPVVAVSQYAFKSLSNIRSLSFGDNIKYIGDYAFAECERIKRVYIRENIHTIGAHAFEKISYLEDIDIYASNIGDYAFYESFYLGRGYSLFFGNSVINIGNYSFAYTYGSGDLIIPDSVKTIGEGAFDYWYSFSSIAMIKIGNSVETIGKYAFRRVGFEGSRKLDLNLQSIKHIGEGAFTACKWIREIIIGANLESVGLNAFGACSITSIIIDSPLISDSSILDSSLLTSADVVYVKNGLTIGSYLLDNFTVRISDKNEYDLYYRNAIANLVFQPINTSSPTTGDGTYNTTEGAVDHVAYIIGTGSTTHGNGYTGIGTIINIPTSFKGKPVVGIGQYAFANAENITEINADIHFPNLKLIGGNAFYNCRNISSFEIPNSISNIEANAFDGCVGLISITIFESVLNISENAFINCINLSTVIIDSEEIAKLDNSTSELISYAGVVYVKTGLSVGAYITGSFTKQATSDKSGYDMYYKTSLLGLVFQPINTLTPASGGSSYNTTEGTREHVAYMIGTGSSTSSNGYNGTETTINIPATFKGKPVVAIGNNAFSNLTSLTTINIPNSVTTIGSNAFNGCSGLYTVTIDSGDISNLTSADSHLLSYAEVVYVKTGLSVGEYITGSFTKQATSDKSGYNMYYKTSLSGLVFQPINTLTPASGNSSYNTTEGAGNHVAYMVGTGSSTYGNGYNGTGETINIPATFKGKPVVAIGNNAFNSSTNLTSLTLTNATNIKIIGGSAFEECTGFTGSLKIPDSVTAIYSFAFRNCTGFIGSLIIPSSVTIIEHGAFYNCTSFTGNLTIPDLVTTIGTSAFSGCTGFTGNLTIGSSVEVIGDGAFYGCSGFTGNLIIPDSVIIIESNAFSGCSGFTGDLIIGNAVETINNGAFFGCNNLNTVTINSGYISNLSSWESHLLSHAQVVYVKTGLSVGEYITGSFTKQATSDKSGYDEYRIT